MRLSRETRRRIKGHLAVLYESSLKPEFVQRYLDLVEKQCCAKSERTLKWNERDVVLITYGDSIRKKGEKPLATLNFFLRERLNEISIVHILPFFPYSSDDGFSIIDYEQVDPQLGNWDDIQAIGEQFDLQIDLVINHISQKSLWFRNYLNGTLPGADFFIEADPKADLSAVVRPRSLPLLTGRGCPYDCIFCTSSLGLAGEGRRLRAVPLTRLAGWLERWKSDLSLERVIVLDDLANHDRRRFDGLLDLLERLRLRVEFPNGLRAELLTREQVVRLARLTGRLKVSLESASRRVQNEILGKHLPPAAVKRVARWCHREGLGLDVHLLVGLPGEHISEVRRTLSMALELYDRYGAAPLVQFPVPLPQTRLAGHADVELVRQLARDPYPAFQHRPQSLAGAPRADYLSRAVATLRRVMTERRRRKVIVNLTYLCNNHCVFCAVGDRPRRHAETSLVTKALEKYHQRGYELLDIDGGEPTLHPGLFEVIERARQLGYGKITLVSNGRRLAYRAFTNRLVASGVDEVLVSLHAHEQRLQADLTGSPDSFEQTTAGIANLLARVGDSRQVAVNTTIVRGNLPYLGELGGLLAGLGVRRWNLQLLTPFGRARGDQLPEQELLQASLLSLLAAPPGDLEIRLVNCPPCLVPGYEQLAAADFGKGARDMVFIGQPAENLQDYLSGRRRQDRRCRGCPLAFACPGWYHFPESP